MSFKQLSTYLTQRQEIPEEKRQATFFYFGKFEYLSKLYKQLNTSVQGYGDYNAKIMVIARDETLFENFRFFLERTLEKYGLHLWDVFVTYLKKTDDEQLNRQALKTEFSIIKPDFILLVSDVNNISKRAHFIPEQWVLNALNGDADAKAKMWTVLKQIIQYRKEEKHDY